MIQHHSRLLCDRSPQGALPVGGRVRLALRLGGRYAGLAHTARLRVWMQGRELVLKGATLPRKQDVLVQFDLQMPGEPGLVWYYFYLDAEQGRIFYGGVSGEGRLYPDFPRNYQITVYDAAFTTPRWFRETICYQIFPDRFYRGQGGGGLPRLALHRLRGRRVVAREYWNEPPLHLPQDNMPHYDPCDYFGGTLQGIEEKLPYLQRLGVGCIYLNPIFEAASNHRYNTADYHRIDPVLGDEADFVALVAAARSRGMALMLDGVFSHTGADSVYFNRTGAYGDGGAYQRQDSPYYSWYRFRHWPDHYASWWGFKSLPELDETDPGFLSFLLDGDSGVIPYWTGLGAAGWRLDVADELPGEVLQRLRASLKKLNPRSVLLGEVWEDASNKVSYGQLRSYCSGRELDSVTNYPMAYALFDFLLHRTNAFDLNNSLAGQRERYPAPMYYALMNLLGSHDTVRALSVLCGAPHRDALPREQQAHVRFDGEALETGKRRLKLASLLQFCLPGVPTVYYGDEAGMQGMADPFNRATYPWGQEDGALLRHYRTLARLRTQLAALHRGLAAYAAAGPDVFCVLRATQNRRDAFGRLAPNQRVLALVNRANRPRQVRLASDLFREGPHRVALQGSFQDAFTGRCARVHDGAMEWTLPALGAALLVQAENN